MLSALCLVVFACWMEPQVGADWQTIDCGVFSFRLPPAMKEVPVRGRDSWVRAFADESTHVSFDYGMYSGRLDSWPEFLPLESVVIGGRHAQLGNSMSPTPDGLAFQVAVGFRHVQLTRQGTHLTMRAACKSESGLRIGRQILESIRFRTAAENERAGRSVSLAETPDLWVPTSIPALLSAIDDPELRIVRSTLYSALESNLDRLIATDAEQVARHARKLADAGERYEPDARKVAARILPRLNRVDLLPVLCELLDTNDGYEQADLVIAAADGFARAASEGTMGDEYREAAFALLRAHCRGEIPYAVEHAVRAMIALRRSQAALEFSSPSWLSPTNPSVVGILQACTKAEILLPADPLTTLFDHVLAASAHTGSSANPAVLDAKLAETLAATLDALVLCLGEDARRFVVRAWDDERRDVQAAAGRAIATLAGVPDPVANATAAYELRGFDSLTDGQRVVYCINAFETSGCEGFVGSSVGTNLDALRDAFVETGETPLASAVTNLIIRMGPISHEPSAEKRIDDIALLDDVEFGAMFDPLRASNVDRGRIHRAMLTYAATRPWDFH